VFVLLLVLLKSEVSTSTDYQILFNPRMLMQNDDPAKACAALSEATNTPRICVTMAAAGAALWDRGNLVSAPAPKVVVKDTVGAGDAFMAGLMVGLTRGADPRIVLETACRLGAIVASHDGATPLLPQGIIQDFRAKLNAEASSENRTSV